MLYSAVIILWAVFAKMSKKRLLASSCVNVRPSVRPSTWNNSLPTGWIIINPLTPNDPYRGRTAPLTSKSCILYIYSTNIGTEYFKHGIHSPFFFSSKCSLFHNSNIFGSCIIHILYTGVLKFKKINLTPKG